MPAVGGWLVTLTGCEASGEGCGKSEEEVGHRSKVWAVYRAELVPGRNAGGGVGVARGLS